MASVASQTTPEGDSGIRAKAGEEDEPADA
jgi:hypothetical protein